MSLVDRFFASVRHRLRLPEPSELANLRVQVGELTSAMAALQATLRDQLDGLHKGTGLAARKLDRLEKLGRGDRMLLERLDRSVRAGAAPIDPAALPVETLPPAPWPAIDEDWWLLSACPVCGHEVSEVVCEYNRFVLNEVAPEPGFEIYNYSLCHACGVVFAARRPRGRRFRALLENFTESLGRAPSGNPVLNPRPLTAADKAEIARRAAPGPLVSEHLGVGKRDRIGGLQADRLAAAMHVEIITSLLHLDQPRVLEIRSRTGAILTALQRHRGAEVFALSMFESQRYIAQQVYGIRSDALIDFEDFAIPYPGGFDLIVSNHMLTHAVAPQKFFEVVGRCLKPDGHLYLYNEPDDGEFREANQSMFRVLNPFHLQTFDPPSLVRILQGNGFEPIFTTHDGHNLIALARRCGSKRLTPMSDDERRRRRAEYQAARDFAVLAAPPEVQQRRFAAELDSIIERAVIAGRANIDERGRVTLRDKGDAALDTATSYH